MGTILKGSGSSLAHALSAASASSLAGVRIQTQGMSARTLGSSEVYFNIVTDTRVPVGTLYSGTGGTLGSALVASGVSALTYPRIMHMDVAQEDNAGSVNVLFTISSDGVPSRLLSGTGSTITHAMTGAGLLALTNPRIHKDAIHVDGNGSVTALFAVTSEEIVPN